MKSIAELLKDCFKKYHQKTAISFLRGNTLETRISYQDLDLNSNKMANLFLKQGVKKSDNVVLLLDKSLVFIVAYIALQKIGAVCVPLNPGFKKFELTYLLNDAAPLLVIINPDQAGMIKQIDPGLTCMEIDTKIPFQEMAFLKSCSNDLEKVSLVPDDPGQIGEFWLKSDSITPGYWKKPKETAKAFEQGWFKTGDLGKKDRDGYYYLTDRLKSIIITGGENVSPNEIESVINRLDEVVESSVLGIFDEKWGEKVVAAVVKAPGSDDISGAVKAVCKEHLHDWKCPKEIIFIEKLPKNTMGKILKENLKKLF